MITSAASSRIRGVLLLMLLLVFGTVGWVHIYHSVILHTSVETSVAGHLEQTLRDGLLALPLAFVAIVGGLWFGRRLSLLGRAALVAGVFGLLLAPPLGGQDAMASGAAVSAQHPAPHQAADGVAGLLQGLPDALVAQVAALPLMLAGLTLLFGMARRRPGERVLHRLRLRRTRVATAVCTAAVTVLASAGLGLATESAAVASVVHTFHLTDNPASWMDAGADIGGTRSLMIAQPGDTVRFDVGASTNTVHTTTSLLWPTGAASMPFNQPHAYRGQQEVVLTTPGAYVFVCRLHPFVLGAVIVDDPATPGLDIGRTITLLNGVTLPGASDLAFQLLRVFFLITNPQNYQVFTRTGSIWDPVYPAVPVLAYDGLGNPVEIPDLNAGFHAYFHEPVVLPPATPPTQQGVGQVWVDTQYEQTAHKTKPGTVTAVETADWRVSRKVALPSVNMNNPHNMWTDRAQSVLYTTQWFDNKLAVIDRKTGMLIRNVTVGDAPAHVMTRVDTDQVHVSIHGEGHVVELSPFATRVDRRISVQSSGEPGHPHGHWMSADGHTMVTPNSNTGDSTVVHLVPGTIEPRVATGLGPIASGMMPDTSKYYVSNYLSNTVSVIDLSEPHPTLIKNINLLANYNPANGAITGPVGGLPIQTPVSPNGRWVLTANTLHAGTITIIDTSTDTLVKSLPCDSGCHGINFGAKKGGGYYAYVSSKFSNVMLVVDPDPNGDGSAADADIVGRVLLTTSMKTKTDDTVTGNPGMGGQGILPVPIVYNGWVQNLPETGEFRDLTCAQRHPIGGGNCF
jgi:DNA-binding beta-propeller fold protein YncE